MATTAEATYIAPSTNPLSPVAGRRVDANGQPVQRYRKDIIRVGKWENGGDDYTVTSGDLDHWLKMFGEMSVAGIKVHCPVNHEHDDAESNRGWVVSMYREGDTLFADMDLIGEDSIKLASRTEVSVFVPAQLKGGNGVVYKYPIAHVALTPIPVISGQGAFVPIAASRGAKKVLRFARESRDMDNLKKIAEAMGIEVAEGDNEEALAAKIVAMWGNRATKTATEVAEGGEGQGGGGPASRKDDEPKKLSRADPSYPMLCSLARENRTGKIDNLVTAGKISPAVAKGLKATFVPGDDEAMSLSLAGPQMLQFNSLIDSLALNDPKVLGEQTKRQTMELNRQTPGEKTAEPRLDPSIDKRKAELGLK